jgi:hypothetical protein
MQEGGLARYVFCFNVAHDLIANVLIGVQRAGVMRFDVGA